MTKTIRIASVAVLCVAAVTVTSAQNPMFDQSQVQRPNRPQNEANNLDPQGSKQALPNEQLSPVYIQQMFDTMAIMEAERFLPLTNEQYPAFLQKLRRLQEAKMQANRRRSKAMNELRPMVGRPNGEPLDVSDATIDAKLKELAAVEADGQAAVRKALEDLDVGLNVRQRARYRLLEENVERRKIDFLTKVRGGGSGFEGIPR